MRDQDAKFASQDESARTGRRRYDLVVVGAGIAGLNALHAASMYLPRTARVLLVDEKDVPGGMWTMAYDYVRLHQPHPLFTVGDAQWNWRKPRNYLATRNEVQQHLAACLEGLRNRFQLETRFGHCVGDVREIEGSDGWHAEVDLSPVNAPQEATTVAADRVIHACGFNYKEPEPIHLSSPNVSSVTPSGLATALRADPDAPIYVVGGGKTGMDVILAVLDENPKRQVTLINGNGTYFLNRNRFFPHGIRRWTGGALPATMTRDCAMRFDGHNEDEMRKHFISTYAVNDDPRSQNYIYGVLSEEENRRIEAGLEAKVWGYLDDVAEGQSGPVIRMRSGEELPVAERSVFVNCTRSLLREGTGEAWVPCLSEHDVILSINTCNAMHILTTYSSFLLTHLHFGGKLREAGLFFLDLGALVQKDKQAFTAATFAQSYHNLLMSLKSLPPSARKLMGMDFNRWYPKPRQIWMLLGIRKTAPEDVQHCRKSLDAIVARFDIKGGLLG